MQRTAVMTAVVVRVWVGPVSPEGREQQIAQSRGIEAQQPRQDQQPQPVRGQGHSDGEEARQHKKVNKVVVATTITFAWCCWAGDRWMKWMGTRWRRCWRRERS